MGYQLGASLATLINASTVFGVNPRSVYVPGTQQRTLAGTDLYVPYAKSKWQFSYLTIAQYKLALAILVSTAGIGTVSGTLGATALAGVTTAFDIELEKADVLAIHIGSGIYEVSIVSSITNATNVVVASAFTQNFSGKAFRYRHKSVYSSTCVIQTRNDLDTYQNYTAIARFKSPAELERSGGKYLNIEIEFVLTGLST